MEDKIIPGEIPVQAEKKDQVVQISTNEKLPINHKLLLIILSVIIVVFGGLLRLYYKKNLIQTSTPVARTQIAPTLAEKAPEIGSTFSYLTSASIIKESLISSNNIDDVTKAIRTGHIPDWGAESRSYASITVKAYKYSLDKGDESQKMSEIRQNATQNKIETLDTNNWQMYPYSEASDMFVKNGYACIYLFPNRFDTPPYVSCANLLDLSNNTYSNVSSFMKDMLTSVGINCENEGCPLVETEEQFPLYKYSRDLVYFAEGVATGNEEILIAGLTDEASKSAEFLRSSGWNVTLEDYTETERRWEERALISLLINADNHFFHCRHTLTIMNQDKRQMVECSYKNEVLEEVQKFYNPYKKVLE